MIASPALASALAAACLLAHTALAEPSSLHSAEQRLDAPPPVARAPSPVSDATVPVWFMSEYYESVTISLYPEPEPKESVPPLMRCQTPCGGRVGRARYRLRIPDTAETVGGTRRIDVKGPSRFTITTHAPTNRTTGFVLGVSGAIVSLAGFVLFFHGLATEHGKDLLDTEALVGGSLVSAGGILAGIGFYVYHHNAKPDIRVEPMLSESAPGGHAGVLSIRNGVGIAGTGVF